MERYDPFEEMDRMFEQLRTRMWTDRPLGGRSLGGDREMGRRGVRTSRSEMARGERGMPRRESEGVSTDLKRRDDEFVFVADLPGFEREDVDLTFEDGVLTLDAESETRDERTDDEGEIRVRGEFASTRRLSERVTVPEAVREDDVSATFRNGVLEVHLPLVAPEDSDDGGKKIDIGE